MLIQLQSQQLSKLTDKHKYSLYIPKTNIAIQKKNFAAVFYFNIINNILEKYVITFYVA